MPEPDQRAPQPEPLTDGTIQHTANLIRCAAIHELRSLACLTDSDITRIANAAAQAVHRQIMLCHADRLYIAAKQAEAGYTAD